MMNRLHTRYIFNALGPQGELHDGLESIIRECNEHALFAGADGRRPRAERRRLQLNSVRVPRSVTEDRIRSRIQAGNDGRPGIEKGRECGGVGLGFLGLRNREDRVR